MLQAVNHCAFSTLTYKEKLNRAKLKVIVHTETKSTIIYSHTRYDVFNGTQKEIFFSIQTVCRAPNRIKNYHKSSFWSLTGTMKYHCMDYRWKSYRFGTTWRWGNDDRMFLWQHLKPFLFLNLDFRCLEMPYYFNKGRNSVLWKLISATLENKSHDQS